MGAGQSDLYKGTYGDKLYNIPDEAKPEYKMVGPGELREESNYGVPQLTNSQRATIKTLDNTIRDHLTDLDFSGTRADLEGNPILKKTGEAYQHLEEMKTSYRTLMKTNKSLEGSLKNPCLGTEERNNLEEAMNKNRIYLEKIRELFEEFGVEP